MELCSHLISEIQIGCYYDQNSYCSDPESPSLMPLETPLDLLDSISGFMLEEDQESVHLTPSKGRKEHKIKKARRSLRKVSKQTSWDSDYL
jgi:hypothetical protein